jgi:chemotaxis protein histidine kinase CheA/ActR/RegA family two-component response regulator
VQLNDLLQLLREEFALDVPRAHEALALWQAEPSEAANCAATLTDFLDRSMQASAVLDMQGFVAYLQLVQDALITAQELASAEYLQWLSGWVEPAVTYLDSPGKDDAVMGVCSYLLTCPVPIEEDILNYLVELLSIAPSLPVDDEPLAELALATQDDVSLATDELDAGLMSALLADAPDQLQRLSDILELLHRHHTVDPALLNEGQRIAHTLKGSGNIIGLPGIGRLAHRLEDVMEYALLQAQAGHAVPADMARDMEVAVHALQQMVAYLQGEDEQPEHAVAVLQRMLDWTQAIRQNAVPEMQFEPISGATTTTAQGRAPAANMSESGGVSSTAMPASSAHAPAGDSPTLRVRVDSLNRLVRRAGQSIVQTQRLAQLLQDTAKRLAELELTHQNLNLRLREFDATVGRQVVQLQQDSDEMDPLEMDRYDALYTLSRFISEGVQDEAELTRQARNELERAQVVVRDENYALRNHHHELLDTRLVPIKTVLPRLKRNVSQTAATTGKQVRLQISGEAVTLDTDILERLTEPLLHMLRNAVDHGIEPAEERDVLGKEAEGVITLSFRRVGHEVEVLCADDGRGLDLGAIYDKALEYGLVTPDVQLTENELRRLILRPGFSTKHEVTEVSGRGVGMDVVNDRIASLKGRLDISSEMFAGTRFTMRVPVTSGSVHALVVRTHGQTLAISADQITSITTGDIRTLDDGSLRFVRGPDDLVPYAELSQWLGDADTAAALQVKSQRAIKPILLVQGDEGIVAVGVDEVVESRELILQDIGRLIRRISGVIGGALRADGKPMMLLDIAQLERAARSALRGASSDVNAALRRRMQLQRTRVLVVDDALSVRRAMQQLLQDGGYEVTTAIDGFDALIKLEQTQPHIMLTDLEMPNLNGLDLTRRVRAMPEFAALPVIMITSRATEKHKDMAVQAGVDEYLSKPYQDADLLAHIRRLGSPQLVKEPEVMRVY